MDIPQLDGKKSLIIDNLSYRPLPDAFENIEQYLISKIPISWQRYWQIDQPLNENTKVLHEISFEAKPGNILGILGGEVATRRSLVDLICGERRYGTYSGDIYMTDYREEEEEDGRDRRMPSGVNQITSSDKKDDGTYHDNIAYIKSKTLYLAGLTYLDMVEYSSRIRCSLEV